MKLRLSFFGLFLFSSLVAIMFFGMGFSENIRVDTQLILPGICSAVVAVLSLIGVFFPDKIKGLFEGNKKDQDK